LDLYGNQIYKNYKHGGTRVKQNRGGASHLC